MKKWKILLIVSAFLLFTQNTLSFGTFTDLAVKGFEKLMERSFFRQVFDLSREEAVAVFGDEEGSLFV